MQSIHKGLTLHPISLSIEISWNPVFLHYEIVKKLLLINSLFEIPLEPITCIRKNMLKTQ